MVDLPIHPLVVHLPLAVAMLLPLVVAVILIIDLRGATGRKSWYVAVAVAAVLTVGAFVSVNSGEKEEEVAEEVVPESALETHEERAEAFMWATLAPLVLLIGASFAVAGRLRWTAAAAAFVASLAVAAMATMVGESGGRLVYEHNAGAAYSQDAGVPGQSGQHEDDD